MLFVVCNIFSVQREMVLGMFSVSRFAACVDKDRPEFERL